MFAGLLAAMAGAFLILMAYSFATMMDPNIQGAAREAAIRRAVVSDESFPVALFLIVAGAWLALVKPKRPA